MVGGRGPLCAERGAGEWFEVEGGWVEVWRGAEGGAEGAGEGAGEHDEDETMFKGPYRDSQDGIYFMR